MITLAIAGNYELREYQGGVNPFMIGKWAIKYNENTMIIRHCCSNPGLGIIKQNSCIDCGEVLSKDFKEKVQFLIDIKREMR